MKEEQRNISPIDQYVIDFVYTLRKNKNHTQEDIASILQVSRSYINNVENTVHNAKYNLTHINALADYYDMKPGDFLPPKAIPVEKSKASAAPVKKAAAKKVKKAAKKK